MPEADTKSKETQVVIFSLAKELFGVRTNQVREISKMIEITNMPKAPAFIKGVINLRGKVIAVIDLAKQLDLPSTPQDKEARIIVVDVDDNIVGMIVDSASEVLRLPEENIEPTPAAIESRIDTRYIEGIGKAKDRLFVLLNLNKVLSSEEVEIIEKSPSS